MSAREPGSAGEPTDRTSPLRRVLQAVQSGAHGRAQIREVADVDDGMLDAALDQLERMGVLQRESIGSACPSGGCGSCPVSGGCAGTPGRGPVLLTLRGPGGRRIG